MLVFEEMRAAVEAATPDRHAAVMSAINQAYVAGGLTDGEYETLDGLLAARRPVARAVPSGARQLALVATRAASLALHPTEPAAPLPGVSANARAGSRPRTDASMERRRRWAASGRLPPGLAARFTLAEQAVLALVAAEVARRKDCRLAVGHLAAIVGVAETTVRNAIREAVKLGLVTVEERRITGFRNDTNIVRIISPEWTAWLRLARRSPSTGRTPFRIDEPKGGGCKSPQRTPTEVLVLSESRRSEAENGCRRAAGDSVGGAPTRIGAGCSAVRAMR